MEGPFAAVSKPIFATKASFFSSRRDLQDIQHSANFHNAKIQQKFISEFAKICKFSVFFLQKFAEFAFFFQILQKFCRFSIVKMIQNLQILQKLQYILIFYILDSKNPVYTNGVHKIKVTLAKLNI